MLRCSSSSSLCRTRTTDAAARQRHLVPDEMHCNEALLFSLIFANERDLYLGMSLALWLITQCCIGACVWFSHLNPTVPTVPTVPHLPEPCLALPRLASSLVLRLNPLSGCSLVAAVSSAALIPLD